MHPENCCWSCCQGNHAEDVKECYYYLDNTPTHSYMKYLYKYPQRRFPHDELLRQSEDRKRLKETRDVDSDEFELLDTGSRLIVNTAARRHCHSVARSFHRVTEVQASL